LKAVEIQLCKIAVQHSCRFRGLQPAIILSLFTLGRPHFFLDVPLVS